MTRTDTLALFVVFVLVLTFPLWVRWLCILALRCAGQL